MMGTIDLETKELFYRFETPGMLGQFIESLADEDPGLSDTCLIDAGEDGIFVPFRQLVQAGVSEQGMMGITEYVEDIIVTNGEALRERFPEAIMETLGRQRGFSERG